jgi:hypothetical protein
MFVSHKMMKIGLEKIGTYQPFFTKYWKKEFCQKEKLKN